jgi:hypothetical protein
VAIATSELSQLVPDLTIDHQDVALWQRGDGVEPRHVIANPTLDRGLLYRSTAERNRSISASASSI